MIKNVLMVITLIAVGAIAMNCIIVMFNDLKTMEVVEDDETIN